MSAPTPPADPTPDDARQWDIVLMGATGFTGRLVADYLAAQTLDPPLRWALAGRSLDRLAAVRAELATQHPRLATLDLVAADSHDREALDRLVRATRVVCTTVGPYAQHGSDLVAACADAGTHYCDLTGEVPWIRRMIDAQHTRAQQTGARIVTCCGFDSIPSDLGTLVLQTAAVARHGRPAEQVTLYVKGAAGTVSGGTVQSLIGVLDEVRNPETRKILGHAYALNPPDTRSGPDRGDQAGPRRDPDARAWTGPFLMAGINTRIVRRSNALLGFPWGREMRYREVTLTGRGPGGWARATGLSLGIGSLALGLSVRPLRYLLQRTVLPAPGAGPDAEAREKGWFRIELVGRGADADPTSTVRVEVVGKRDPGYGATAAMLGESALCLAFDPLDSPGGLLTPASAMGQRLVDRLNRSLVTFRVLPPA